LTESVALRSGGVSLVCLVTPVVAVSSGAKALGMLLHEASIIVTKERAEMKMIEFFITRKIVVDGGGTFNHKPSGAYGARTRNLRRDRAAL
jgi:hypothetical protein